MGRSGDDTLLGGTGWDFLVGGAGADVLDGGESVDFISYITSAAGVTVDLATGVATGGDAEGDTLTNIENAGGSNHSDMLTARNEGSQLWGYAGDDTLAGGDGNDYLVGVPVPTCSTVGQATTGGATRVMTR